MSTRNALLALIAGTLLGIISTLVTSSEPGILLGFFIIVGSLVATLGVRRGAVYLFFPMPAFAFFVGAIITGKVKDSDLGSSTAGLGAGFTQWTADIFLPMLVGTILVLLVGGARWLLGRQLVTGQFPMSADRPASPRGPRKGPGPASGPGRLANSDPWADLDRPVARRDDRETWSDPRPAADRRPPARNVPPDPPQPSFRPRPAAPAPPADRPARRPGRDPRDQAPQRPARLPRDSWDQGYQD